MKHKRLTINSVLALLLVMVVFPKSAMAQTIYDTYPSFGLFTWGWSATAQTITAPPESNLIEYRWRLNARDTPGSVRFAIYEWGGAGPNGPALYETYLAWDAEGDYEVTGINLQLTEGTLYGMVIDLLGYSYASVHYTQNLYPGGNGYWTYDPATQSWVSFPDLDHVFRAVFEPSNSPPTADPNGPYLGAVNTSIGFDGSESSDPDGDSLTYAWDFGDSNTGAGATPNHTYAEAGIYDVCLTSTDTGGLSDTACTIAVVYDPSVGFVTGAGWIDSPAGAYVADPSLTGKANFGFVSKYKKGADTPTGNTEFQFHAAGLNFHSGSYEWLVVNQGDSNAQFKGEGTINGVGSYKFMLWAGDGDPDTFRIRIWEEDEFGVETVVYDNGFDQALGGGSILIHTKK